MSHIVPTRDPPLLTDGHGETSLAKRGSDVTVFVATPEAELRENERELLAASIPPNTRRGYQADWKIFKLWCEVSGRSSLPASSDDLRAFITDRTTRKWPKGRGRKDAPDTPTTIERRVSAICTIHSLQSMPSPRDGKLKNLLKGIRRSARQQHRRATPMLEENLRRAMVTMPSDGAIAVRNKALLLTGFGCALRRSELVGLLVSDVKFLGNVVQVEIRFSKTDQEGLKPRTAVLDAVPGDTLCAVAALKAWLKVRGSDPGPLFPRIDARDKITTRHLSGGYIAKFVKQIITTTGEDPRNFSGHSLRAGFATQASLNGAPEWEIREQTGHESDVLQDYIRPGVSARRHIMKRML